MDRFDKLRATTLELCRIPSPSAAGDGENRVMDDLERRLSGALSRKPGCCSLFRYPLPRDPYGRSHVAALWRCPSGTKDTVILMGHVDVVEAEGYGPLTPWAYDPEELTRRMASADLPEEARRDLRSGRFLFGRGTMDMKAGIALHLDLFEEALENPERFGVNLLFCPVVDEENDSAGMRGAIPFLTDLARNERLRYLACLNAEPCDLGSEGPVRPLYVGTIGKIMPLALLQGREAHVGEVALGINAALLASSLVEALDGDPQTCERTPDGVFSPAICMGLEIRRRAYSVTVPARAAVYFNLLTVTRTPAEVLDLFRDRASSALATALEKRQRDLTACGLLPQDAPTPRGQVLEAGDLLEQARRKGFDPEGFLARLDPHLDAREKALRILEAALDAVGAQGPLAVLGFLPPYYPQRLNQNRTEGEKRLREVAQDLVGHAQRTHGETLEIREVFGGITDLSFLGFQGRKEDLEALARNLPGWGTLYDLDRERLLELDVPILNVGTAGKDAHKWTERLDTEYSFRVTPDLLRFVVDRLAEQGRP